jgi:preprotein translocase subunit SecA
MVKKLSRNKKSYMLNFFKNIFDENKKNLGRYQSIIDKINNLEKEISQLSNKDLKNQTPKLREKLKSLINKGKSEPEALNIVLPEAFATVRETAKRVLSMRHFDVQLMAGIALHEGKTTEQRTGEGKTLTVTLPIYLNSLLKKGTHLITVNDYLAEVGLGWMGPVYHFLSLSCAVIVHDESKLYNPDVDSEEKGDERLEHFEKITRQEAYNCDITYGNNNEFGFDYLRDNMARDIEKMAQRSKNDHNFAIVDEADSILIDEARTPLIISAPNNKSVSDYYQFARIIDNLTKEEDYKLDEKSKTATLTDLGVKRVEKKLGVKNLYEESFDTIHYLENALKAQALYRKDREYIVRDNQVIIVDEHTGRLMYGRRYSDGLHQAIEAKENVPIQQESRTMATISLQNYFKLYQKLAGMSGTAVTEREEFLKIYSMDVVEIPTHVPIDREDRSDIVYKTTSAKYGAIFKEIEEVHQTGRPILVGTRSIEHNDIIDSLLKKKKVPHQVLNAKNNKKEAFIIAEAGKKGAITVATNIAGRGVDIILGGSKPEIKDFRLKHSSNEQKDDEENKKIAQVLNLPANFKYQNYDLKSYQQAINQWKEKHQEIVGLGGLHIVGSERHESRRIDNQLRGRSGRQGDPGSSQFFLSLEDDIMRIFGGEQISKLMTFLKIPANQPIEAKIIGKSIESAQMKVEGFFFDQRKRLVDFDNIMNKHREIIYNRRKKILGLELENEKDVLYLKTEVKNYLKDYLEDLILFHTQEEITKESLDLLVTELCKLIPFDDRSQFNLKKSLHDLENYDEIKDKLSEIIDETYQKREEQFSKETMSFLEKNLILATIDEKWIEHLENIDDLKDGIWLRGDKQTVLNEYQKEAFGLFEQLMINVSNSICQKIFRVQVDQNWLNLQKMNLREKKEDVFESIDKEVADASLPTKATVTKTKGNLNQLANALKNVKPATNKIDRQAIKKVKIGRNDPCPCGSGKKYKKCCMLKE